MFCFFVGLDVDGHDGLAEGVLERRLQPVTDRMRPGHGHRAGHDEVEVDKGRLAGQAGAKGVGFDRFFRIGRDDLVDSLDFGSRRRLVEQSARIFADHVPAAPQDVAGDERRDDRVENQDPCGDHQADADDDARGRDHVGQQMLAVRGQRR